MAAKTLNVGLCEKNVTSDQIIMIDMKAANAADSLNSNGLNRHFQYHSTVGLKIDLERNEAGGRLRL